MTASDAARAEAALGEEADADTVTGFGAFRPVLTSDGPLEVTGGRLVVPGLGCAWLAEP